MSRRQFALPNRDSAEPPDDTGCTVLHVDMDAFYAAATLLSHPELVGHPRHHRRRQPRRRALGDLRGAPVRGRLGDADVAGPAAVPAGRRPAPGPHASTARSPRRVMETFRSVTPVVEPLSLDEAFLDVSGRGAVDGQPGEPSASTSATPSHDEQGITCSVGVALDEVRREDRLRPGQARRAWSSSRREEVVPFVQQLPVGGPVGGGGAHRGGPAAARAAHRRRHRPHPARRPSCAGSARPPGGTCTTCPGAATPAWSSGCSARRASAATRPSSTTSTTPPRSTGELLRSASAPRPGCGPPASRGAPSPCG